MISERIYCHLQHSTLRGSSFVQLGKSTSVNVCPQIVLMDILVHSCEERQLYGLSADNRIINCTLAVICTMLNFCRFSLVRKILKRKEAHFLKVGFSARTQNYTTWLRESCIQIYAGIFVHIAMHVYGKLCVNKLWSNKETTKRLVISATLSIPRVRS